MRTVFSRPVFLVLAAAALSMLCMAAAGPGIEGNANSAAVLPPEMAKWDGPQDNGTAESENPKIGPELMGLVKSSDSDSSGDSTMDSSSLAVSGADLVPIQVLAKPDDLETVKSALLFLGGEVGGIGTVGFGEGGCEPDLAIVQGFAPVAVLEELASRDAVAYLRAPLKALMVCEDKDAQLPADFDLEAWHKEGYRGGGVKVGIVDSGFAENAPTDLVGFSVVKYRNFADGEPEDSPGGDSLRGWESVGIVGEIAPDAEIYAARAETYVDVQEAVSWLAEEIGADVIRVPAVCFPTEDAPAFPESSDVFWATPNGFAWNEYGFGPFEDGGDGLHLFGHERNVEPVYFAPDPPLSSENVFLRREDGQGGNMDLDLFLLRWDGSNWQPVAESKKTLPEGFIANDMEILSVDSFGEDAIHGIAVRGSRVEGNLLFDILMSEAGCAEKTTDDGAACLTSSQAAGIAALIMCAQPDISPEELQSLVSASLNGLEMLLANQSAGDEAFLRILNRESGCIHFEYLNIVEFDTPVQWEAIYTGEEWIADKDLSALSLNVQTTGAKAGVEIRIRINSDDVIDSWRVSEDGLNMHLVDISANISAGDTITYERKNGDSEQGFVKSPITVDICDAPAPTTGSLSVSITPEEAVADGAKWCVDSGAWQSSGTTLDDLSPGEHTVSFNSIFGWDSPENESVIVIVGETTATSGTYNRQFGSLQVNIGPQEALDGGAKWQVDGGQWLDSGATAGGLPVASHVVSFKAVRKWTASDQSVVVNNGSTNVLDATYTPEPDMTGNDRLTWDYNGNVGFGATYPEEKAVLSEGGFLQTAGAPKHLKSLPTELKGARDIFISGKYAYLVSYDDDGVEIIDISSPSNPTQMGVIAESPEAPLEHELDGAIGIFVSGKYAYVASFIDDGVAVLDISDPSNPVQVGSITDEDRPELELDGACSIFVSGKYAYVAAYEDDGVEILDISDPSNPVHIGSLDGHDDGTTELDGARTIQVSGKYAYVASELDDGVEILDISDPSNPSHVGSIDDHEDDATELDGARNIQVAGKFAYVASYYDHGVEILDISDPSSPVHVGSISDNEETLLISARGIKVCGKYAYVTSDGERGVEVLDISDPSAPKHIGSIADDSSILLRGPASIFISGKYAYVPSYLDHGLAILDISGIDAPAASIGAIAANNLDVSERLQIGNTLSVGGGVNVGAGGIKSDGALSAEGDASIGGDLDVENEASFGEEFGASGRISISDALKLAPRESPPPDPQNGYVYYDRTDPDAVCVYLEGQWVRIAGTGACQ